MSGWKEILTKFKSWKEDIYESNRLTWTDEDDSDLADVETLIEQKVTIDKFIESKEGN